MPIRVALLECSHWHVPLYLDALARPGIEVVAVSDRLDAPRERVAGRFGARGYADYRSLLEREAPDFVFAFGRHDEMPAIADALIARRLPFAIEKPAGTRADDAARLRRAAAGLFVAVPLVQRLSDLASAIRAAEGPFPVDARHMAFRFVPGSLARYEAADCGWMLDPRVSGGGCAINLAVHFVDLFLVATGSGAVTVTAQMCHRQHGAPVEDYAAIMLCAEGGAVAVIETGYTFPAGAGTAREFSFAVSTAGHYLYTAGETVRLRSRAEPDRDDDLAQVRLDSDILYPLFVERTLADWREGRAPVADLGALERAMRVVDAAYVSARQEGAPQRVALA